VVLAIGGRLRLDAPRTSVRATPSGVVELVEHGDWTSVVGRTPGEVSVETTDGDGGVATSVQVRVEAIISPEVLLRLRPGRRAVVLTPGRVRWSIGDPSIVLVREGEGGLELRGARAGSTTLEAWFQDGSSRKWPVQVEVETETAGSLRLVLGHQKVLSVPSLESVTVTPAGVVDTRRMGSQMLLLIGQGEGLATVEVARAGKPPLRYQVTVTREVVDSITPKRPSTWPVRPLVPVLVAASDLEANTVITLPLITQRSMAEGDDRAAAVGVEAVSHVIGRPILVPLKAGETLRWIHFGLTKSPAPSP
jgi:hypothetical protein